ncbi:coiled-coil domain-containing protein 60-like isoform X1 [Littorina saxatilis]|uniref:coiled-coil domain-containing protein 60-like isoform X1 n=1 Tax=Littorina saxatilis TaxID=31220 RepID=UPI0038B5C36F
MIRNVSLGHGLFDLIRQERMAKKTAAMLEKQKKLELARNMWQPPKRDSETEEESDDDIIQDDDSDLAWWEDDIQDTRPSTGNSRRDSLFDTKSGYSSGENSQARQSGKASSKKKKALIPRPYTPQHNSLIDVPELVEDETSQHALFRQLCVLNWILDAMNVEQGYTMSHIMTCWSHNEIGGTKVTVRKAQQEKQTETKWERFLSTPGKVSFKFV